MQPDSIRKFSLFYLGALVVSLVATYFGYGALTAQIEAQSAESGIALGSGALLGSILFNVVITLLLWYLVARKGYAIAKWIIVLLFLFTLFSTVRGLLAGSLPFYELIALLAFAMQAAAVYYLFQPDAKAWLSSDRQDDPVDPAPED